MKCTIQSIADELELSRNTVARALSGKEGVSAKTRKLVLRKAEERGYGFPAVPLPKKQLPPIPESIVFLTDLSMGASEARTAVIQAVEEYIKKQNYTLILAVVSKETSADSSITLSEAFSADLSAAVDSVTPADLSAAANPVSSADLSAAANPVSSASALKKELQLPAVLYSPSVRGICMMDITDAEIMKAVLNLNLPTAAVFSSSQNHESFTLMETFEERIDIVSADSVQYMHRLASALERRRKSSVRFISRQELIPELFTCDTFPDYFLCEDDRTAIHLIHAAQAAGFSIPDDFSVIGCGNLAESAHVFPPLTTIQIPWQQMGTAAARCITDRINNPELSCMSIRFNAKLAERCSASI